MGKQLFESNPLNDHPMFSKATKPAEKKPVKPVVKRQPAAANKVPKSTPKPPAKGEPVEFFKKTFYLTGDIHKNLKLYAVQNDIDISVLVRQIFTDFLKKKGVAL